ncbi:MAG: hypothetical protein WBP81_22810 [Solirubrobacteraceae bacterium]
MTLPAARAANAARILGARHVIPVHFEGWAHFSQGAAELRAAFAQAGVAGVLHVPEPGGAVAIPLTRSPAEQT